MVAPSMYLSVAIFFFSLVSSSDGFIAQINGADEEIPQNCSNSDTDFECEIRQMKPKVARLELLLKETSIELHTKSLCVDNCEKKIEEISHTIHHLESVLSNLKGIEDDGQMISALEEKIQELEVVVRKNGKDLQLLKIRTEDAENRVKLRASQVETVAKIIPELWFHVQKLEQACEVIERRTAELRKHIRNHKCFFFKFINNLPGRRYQNKVFSHVSKAGNQLRRLFTVIKKYHHELQGLIREEMERNEFTVVFADQELVFFSGFCCDCLPHDSCFDMAVVTPVITDTREPDSSHRRRMGSQKRKNGKSELWRLEYLHYSYRELIFSTLMFGPLGDGLF